MYHVGPIDHVELFVPDRREAAAWYRRVLGLEILPEFESWASDPAGPLMISSDHGETKLALFEGRSQGARPTSGFHRVAFRVDGRAFARFVERLKELQLMDQERRVVTGAAVADHGGALSLYFCDPYGHRLEVTTYDHDDARARLGRDRSR